MTDITPQLLARTLEALRVADPKEYEALMAMTRQVGEIEEMERAKSEFLSFAKMMWPGILLGPHHKEMAKVIEGMVLGKMDRAIVNMAPRMPYALDTPVPTMEGWKTIATLAVGDAVFRPDGSPVRVVGKSSPIEDDLYEVETIDGSRIVCNGDHEWFVRLRGGSFKRWSTLDLYRRQGGEFIYHVKRPKAEPGADWRPPILPLTEAVQYPARCLPIDPYVLGVWLGDGHGSHAIITSHDDDSPEIRREIERRGYVTTDQATPMTFGVKKLLVKLRALGVLGNKHIPQAYLIGSVEQRIDLLRGLMDTDGCVDQNGQCTFGQKNPEIIRCFRQLLHSLGVKNFVSWFEAKIGEKGYGIHGRVSFWLKDCCFLERKRSRTRNPLEKNRHRSIKIRKLNAKGWVQCIEVDCPRGLFQVGEGYLCGTNSKSEFFSYLMPAWYIGHNPKAKIIQICGTSDMAVGWSRKVRNLIASPEYQKLFPGVGLRQDSKAAGRWHTTHGGEYFAVGAEGNVTGKGGDIVIIDDPTGEQQAVTALTDPSVYRKVYDWYIAGPRQRLQPGGRICVVQSRWATNDFTGQLLKAEREADSEFADRWHVIQLPAILNGKSIWPEFWSWSRLEATRLALPPQRWNAQYLQEPSNSETALIKREYWKRWPGPAPKCHFTMITMDTAYSDKETADFTAMTIWGVFAREIPDDPKGRMGDALILLNAWKDRINFPDLKAAAHREYQHWQPDMFIVEAKASGMPLIHEMRQRGIPVSEFTPVRGTKYSPNSKVVRVNAITDIMASGMVYAPTLRWAEDVIEECDGFPQLEHDDYVDCVVMALMRFRQGGLIRLPTDEEWDEPQTYRPRKFY